MLKAMTLTLKVHDEVMIFNMLKAMDTKKRKEKCYRIEVLDPIIEKRMHDQALH